MFAEGTLPEQIGDPQIDQVRHNVRQYVDAAGLKLSQVGKSIGRGASTISEFLKGNYKGNRAQLAIDLDAWLEAEYRRQEAPSTVRFVWTQVAREIKMMAGYAQQMRKIVLVYGPETAGVGKTWTFEALAQEMPGSAMVTCDKQHASSQELLRRVAGALHVNHAKSSAELFDRIVAALKGTPRLLLVDQVHNLCGVRGDKSLFTLCDIFDASGAPQLWGGTVDMVEYLNRHEPKQETLAQIRSRIGMHWDLMQRTRSPEQGGRGEPLYSLDEIRDAFGSNKMRLASDAARFLLALANLEGGGAMRLCEQLVTFATMLAKIAGDDALTLDLLRDALRHQMPGPKAVVLEQRVQAEQPRLKLAAG